MISGALSGLAAVAYCALSASVDPNAGSEFELEAIAAGPARLGCQFTIWRAGYFHPGNGISPTWGARTCEATRHRRRDRRRSNRGLLSNAASGAARRTVALAWFGFAALARVAQGSKILDLWRAATLKTFA